MSDPTPALLRAALDGKPEAVRALVDALTPTIQARIVHALLRRVRSRRDLRQEVEDLTQDVFCVLFAHDARTLRSWEPTRGLSLRGFVALVAERHVASVLRSGRRNPWRDRPEELDVIESASDTVPGAEPRIASKEALARLLDRLREALSARGLVLFERLYVDQEPIEAVAKEMGMTRDAIYAWRNRVGKLVRRLQSEADSARQVARPADVAPVANHEPALHGEEAVDE